MDRFTQCVLPEEIHIRLTTLARRKRTSLKEFLKQIVIEKLEEYDGQEAVSIKGERTRAPNQPTT